VYAYNSEILATVFGGVHSKLTEYKTLDREILDEYARQTKYQSASVKLWGGGAGMNASSWQFVGADDGSDTKGCGLVNGIGIFQNEVLWKLMT